MVLSVNTTTKMAVLLNSLKITPSFYVFIA